MNSHDSFARAQANYDNQLPPEDGPEPSEAHIEEAFDNLMADTDVVDMFIDECNPASVIALFQLQHRDGLPSLSWSERDDDLRDSYDTLFSSFEEEYRDWLWRINIITGYSRLAKEANRVMQAEIDAARDEAEDMAALDRWDDTHLNGGW